MRALLVVLLSILPPGAAWACPMCISANDQNRVAFLSTTILLSLLPLGMVGGGLLWLRRRARLLSDRESNEPS